MRCTERSKVNNSTWNDEAIVVRLRFFENLLPRSSNIPWMPLRLGGRHWLGRRRRLLIILLTDGTKPDTINHASVNFQPFALWNRRELWREAVCVISVVATIAEEQHIFAISKSARLASCQKFKVDRIGNWLNFEFHFMA